jgi:hypothetical protein
MRLQKIKTGAESSVGVRNYPSETAHDHEPSLINSTVEFTS